MVGVVHGCHQNVLNASVRLPAGVVAEGEDGISKKSLDDKSSSAAVPVPSSNAESRDTSQQA